MHIIETMKEKIEMTDPPTVTSLIDEFVRMKARTRSKETARSYRSALLRFKIVLSRDGKDPDHYPIDQVNEDDAIAFAEYNLTSAPATESQRRTSLAEFFGFLELRDLAPFSSAKLAEIYKEYGRKISPSVIPYFSLDDIEKLIQYAETQMRSNLSEDATARLIDLRDRALILVLADTGLRIHEAIGLNRGTIDRENLRAVIVGKGGKEGVVRFSMRAMAAVDDYLEARRLIDGASGKPLASLPIFARHDRGAGKHVKRMTPTAGRLVFRERVREALGEEAVGTITPHTLRHYFVTIITKDHGLKVAKDLARHASIQSTDRYAHYDDKELEEAYRKSIEEK